MESTGALAPEGYFSGNSLTVPSFPQPVLAAEGLQVGENTIPQGLKPNFPFCPSGGAAKAAPFQGKEISGSNEFFRSLESPDLPLFPSSLLAGTMNP
jgi:hypothetical protein